MTRTTILICKDVLLSTKAVLLAILLASSFFSTRMLAQTTTPANKATVAGTPSSYQPNRMPRRATAFYEGVWGVDSLRVKTAESGELIRFSYRVLDPEKSKSLNDKALEPALVSPAAHISLVIPSLEKVGQLRQSTTPEAGKSYWMAFSNPGRKVKRGDQVDVIIGHFRAQALVVE